SNYSYQHKQLPAGSNYYRLLVRDKNGSKFYSRTVILTINTNITLIKGMRPTMVRTQAFVDIYSVKTQAVNITLLDMAGRTVAQYKRIIAAGDNSVPLSIIMLAQGHYNLQIKTDDGVMSNIRFMKE
ncbi:MAG: T9SS type A sorting domain-containing protein, partial [Bacteroidota bacterium]